MELALNKGLGLRTTCLLCKLIQLENHNIRDCAALERAEFNSHKLRLARTIRFDRFSGCFKCGFPQAICERWYKIDTGYVRNWSEDCQYGLLYFEILALIYVEHRRTQGIRAHICRSLQLETRVSNEEIVRKAGKKIGWQDMETNLGFRALVEYIN